MFPFFLFFLFPYANDNPWQRFPLATVLLIIVNVFAYLCTVWLPAPESEALVRGLMYRPGESAWFTLLTCTFLHAGLFHLGFNLWFFYLVGGQVEERMGTLWFVLFYLGGGLSASLGHGLYCWLIGQPLGLLGSSGSIYAVLGAYFVLYPFKEFRFWYFILYRWGTIKIATLFYVGYKVLGDVIWAWSQVAHQASSNIGHWSHLGGLAFGVAVALAAFGAYPFTGKRPLSREEKARHRRFRRASRRKFYSDDLLVERMSEAELAAATDDITPLEAIRRGLFFHNGRMLEWGYQEMLFENPKACVKPAMQLEMIEMLCIHGRDGLAEVAAWNLIEAHPNTPEAIQARFELGRMLARLPGTHHEALRLLREFLASEPALRERSEAERLVRRLEERPLWRWRRK